MAYAPTRPATRPSLLSRITENEIRAAYTVDSRYLQRDRQASFSEQYRGTEYETPMLVEATPAPEPATLSRPRAFVLFGGASVLGILALLAFTLPN